MLTMDLCTMVTGKFTNDLGVAFFADHTRPLTDRFDSKLPGVGNSLVRQLERYLH